MEAGDATLEESSFFALVSRMKYIERWALMRSTRPENLSEHSLEVAVIAHALATIANVRYGRSLDAGRAALMGMFHDASEILTGDLPTPIKYYNPEIKSAYKQIEAVSCEKLLALLPPELQAGYRPLLFESDPGTAKIVKAADKLSAHLKCLEELKAGNQEFGSAAEQTRQALEDYRMPELDYFLTHFLPAFSCTLDQLQAFEAGQG